MAIEFTWKITNMIRKPTMDGLSDVVRKVHFDVLASDPDHPDEQGRVYGDCALDYPDPETFTAFESLTPQEVLTWVQAMPDVDVAGYEAAARRNLERKINPPTIAGLPANW